MRLKLAVTLFAALIATMHEAVALHAPPQPANIELLAELADRLTEAPEVKLAEHVLPEPPQSIPEGELVTVPPPLPAVDTVRTYLVPPEPPPPPPPPKPEPAPEELDDLPQAAKTTARQSPPRTADRLFLDK
jgi:hypothetical protein